MPMAAFTTLAVLGGGAGEPPSWMRPGSGVSPGEDTQEQLDQLSTSLDLLAADAVEANQRKAEPQVHTPAIIQHVVVPVVPQHHPTVQGPVEDTSSMVDDLDFERMTLEDVPVPSEEAPTTLSHNDAVIRGFDLEKGISGGIRWSSANHVKATFLCSILLAWVDDDHAPLDAVYHCHVALDANRRPQFCHARPSCLRAGRHQRRFHGEIHQHRNTSALPISGSSPTGPWWTTSSSTSPLR